MENFFYISFSPAFLFMEMMAILHFLCENTKIFDNSLQKIRLAPFLNYFSKLCSDIVEQFSSRSILLLICHFLHYPVSWVFCLPPLPLHMVQSNSSSAAFLSSSFPSPFAHVPIFKGSLKTLSPHAPTSSESSPIYLLYILYAQLLFLSDHQSSPDHIYSLLQFASSSSSPGAFPIIWGLRNGYEYHSSTLSCPVHPPPFFFLCVQLALYGWSIISCFNPILSISLTRVSPPGFLSFSPSLSWYWCIYHSS